MVISLVRFNRNFLSLNKLRFCQINYTKSLEYDHGYRVIRVWSLWIYLLLLMFQQLLFPSSEWCYSLPFTTSCCFGKQCHRYEKVVSLYVLTILSSLYQQVLPYHLSSHTEEGDGEVSGCAEILTVWNVCNRCSNGDLDPWSAGGVLKSPAPSLVSIMIENAAHHLDLRSSNPLDTEAVIEARKQEKAIVKSWLQQYWNYPLPSTPKQVQPGFTRYGNPGFFKTKNQLSAAWKPVFRAWILSWKL